MSRTPQKCKLLKLPPLKIRISSEHSKLTSLDTLKTNYLSTEMTNSFENKKNSIHEKEVLHMFSSDNTF